jgi:hypothetical protein
MNHVFIQGKVWVPGRVNPRQARDKQDTIAVVGLEQVARLEAQAGKVIEEVLQRSSAGVGHGELQNGLGRWKGIN